jgi:hypothetical protein
MKALQRFVVVVLLGIWCFPAMSFAKPLPPSAPAPIGAPAETTATQASTASESASLAQREQQAPDLQNFKGGAVAVYIGSGALLVIIIVLLIILL